MKTQITRAPSRRRRRQRRWPLFLLLAAALVIAVGFSHLGSGQMRHLKSVSLPDWVDVQIIPVNGAARRGETMKKVTDIAIHYVGNPGTTAQANRNYFAQPDTQVSAHFLVGAGRGGDPVHPPGGEVLRHQRAQPGHHLHRSLPPRRLGPVYPGQLRYPGPSHRLAL